MGAAVTWIVFTTLSETTTITDVTSTTTETITSTSSVLALFPCPCWFRPPLAEDRSAVPRQGDTNARFLKAYDYVRVQAKP